MQNSVLEFLVRNGWLRSKTLIFYFCFIIDTNKIIEEGWIVKKQCSLISDTGYKERNRVQCLESKEV